MTATKFVRAGSSPNWRRARHPVKRPSGLYARSDSPDNLCPSAWWPYYDGWVINSGAGVPGACVSWAELQPNGPGTPLVTTAIDTAIAHARTIAAANPGVHWNLILRLMGGIWAPAWAKALDGAALPNLGGNQAANFSIAGNGVSGVTATGGTVTALGLHNTTFTIASGQYVAVIDAAGRTNTFQLTGSAISSGGYQTVTATGTDTWGWAASTAPLTAVSASTAAAALTALPQRVQNTVTLTGFTPGAPTTIGRWWTSNYYAALQDFYTRLAAIYDAVPEIVAVTDMAAMTTFSEPCDKTGWYDPANAQQLINVGWTLAAEATLQRAMYDFLPTVWKNTSTMKSFNPYSELSATQANGYVQNVGDAVGNVNGAAPTAGFGTPLLAYGQVNAPAANPSIRPEQILLENNSLRATGGTTTPSVVYPVGAVVPHFPSDSWTPTYGAFTDSYDDTRSGNYTTLYAAMAGYGRGNARNFLGTYPATGYRYPSTHIHIQTATGSAMGGATNLPQALAYAAWLGAGSVETLDPFASGMSVSGGDSSQVAYYRNAIKANG